MNSISDNSSNDESDPDYTEPEGLTNAKSLSLYTSSVRLSPARPAQPVSIPFLENLLLQSKSAPRSCAASASQTNCYIRHVLNLREVRCQFSAITERTAEIEGDRENFAAQERALLVCSSSYTKSFIEGIGTVWCDSGSVGKKTLVLGLEDTLVHTDSSRRLEGPDAVFALAPTVWGNHTRGVSTRTSSKVPECHDIMVIAVCEAQTAPRGVPGGNGEILRAHPVLHV